MTLFADVLLPLSVSTPYRYAVPDALTSRVVTGTRVLVPVRRRRAVGVVAGLGSEPPAEGTEREILAAPDAEPALSPELLRLGEWLSSYYGCPRGLSLRALLPGALWGGRAGRVEGPPERTERTITLVEALPSLLERERAFSRSPKRRVAYEALEALGGTAPLRHLVAQLKLGPTVLTGLVRQGLARIDQVAAPRDPFADLAVAPPPELTADQRRVMDEILATPPETPVLIEGVTGSGKTLIYLEVLRSMVESGRGAILLVPEIALTPQTVGRVRGVFGDAVAVLHSGLSDAERADAWRALRQGKKRVAVGARSAIFAPVQRLAVIVVDEEHESSYKQGTAPRYHARDVALARGRVEGARVLFGSATPSLELLHQVAHGSVRRVELPRRIGDRPLPPVETVDLRSAERVPEAGPVAWSEPLDRAVREALERKEQVILLLNRRGFASFLQCPTCGTVPGCPRCAISLTVHTTPSALRCHYCGHEEPLGTACAHCGATTRRMRGLGTQQLEHFLGARFPAARIARMDLDTTSTKWSHHRILDRVARGEVDILLGTQMIAKGLDFPGVTVVGVVDADTGLHLPDFRAAERTFQLVAQVAGRAGRGPAGGRVVVQTRSPDHHALRAAATHSIAAFAAMELPLRALPNPPYPPHVGLIRFVALGRTEDAAAGRATRVAEWLRRANSERLGGALIILGPAPCPIARLHGRWRSHVLIKSAEPRILGRVMRAWRAQGRSAALIVADRDPVSLL
ncbi:MAG TPA: primosomal protein N' [Gemmatimonadales bacterium]|nr:primosomal protein N' [Gemmatimonadales bacterium]